jgi:hypothetical protein
MVYRPILPFVLAAVVTGVQPELPDTSGIDFVLTDKLNVDQFFSLWLVFNNDDVRMAGRPVFQNGLLNVSVVFVDLLWSIINRELY